MQRVYNARGINEIVNHPEVKPWVALPGQGTLDLTSTLADWRNVLLTVSGGGLLFHWQEPGVYEVHIQFLPEARGIAALSAVREGLEWMFLRTDAMEVLTKVPAANAAAGMIVRAIHGVKEFEIADGAAAHSTAFWSLRYPDWFRTTRGLEVRGADFHRKLEEELSRVGMTHSEHPPCPVHDRAVGATMGMILAGQVDKGIILYNRWARFAGYAEVRLVSRVPLVIDIEDALLAIQDESFVVVPRPDGRGTPHSEGVSPCR